MPLCCLCVGHRVQSDAVCQRTPQVFQPDGFRGKRCPIHGGRLRDRGRPFLPHRVPFLLPPHRGRGPACTQGPVLPLGARAWWRPPTGFFFFDSLSDTLTLINFLCAGSKSPAPARLRPGRPSTSSTSPPDQREGHNFSRFFFNCWSRLDVGRNFYR